MKGYRIVAIILAVLNVYAALAFWDWLSPIALVVAAALIWLAVQE